MVSSLSRVWNNNNNTQRRLVETASAVDVMMDVDSVSAARRRRERRLRQFLRHERPSVAMAPSEKKAPHPKGSEEGHGRGVARDALHSQVPGEPTSGEAAFPPRPQERVPQRTVEPMLETFVPVPSLYVLVPQPVNQLVDVLRLIDTVVPEQVIDVPKIPKTSSRSALCSMCRRWRNSWWTSPCPPSTTWSSLRKKRRRSSRAWSRSRTRSRTSWMLLATRGAGSLVWRGLLVDDRHIHCPVDPSGGVDRQARAG